MIEPYDEAVAAKAAYKKKVRWLLIHCLSICTSGEWFQQQDGFKQLIVRAQRLAVLLAEEIRLRGPRECVTDDPDEQIEECFRELMKPYFCSAEEDKMNSYEDLAFMDLLKEAGKDLEASSDSTKELYKFGGPYIPVAAVVERTKQMQAIGKQKC